MSKTADSNISSPIENDLPENESVEERYNRIYFESEDHNGEFDVSVCVNEQEENEVGDVEPDVERILTELRQKLGEQMSLVERVEIVAQNTASWFVTLRSRHEEVMNIEFPSAHSDPGVTLFASNMTSLGDGTFSQTVYYSPIGGARPNHYHYYDMEEYMS